MEDDGQPIEFRMGPGEVEEPFDFEDSETKLICEVGTSMNRPTAKKILRMIFKELLMKSESMPYIDILLKNEK
jgi:hypothetical protein